MAPSRSAASPSSSPSSFSITKKGSLASEKPKSVILTTLGWEIRDEVLASRMKRSIASGFVQNSGLSTLIATCLPIATCSPR